MKIYKKSYLQDELKKRGLPYSYRSLMRYEKAGVIPGAKSLEVQEHESDERHYTEQEIEQIIASLQRAKQA